MKFKSKPFKYCVKTLGCQANISDSAKLSGVLETLGLKKTTKLSDANILIINSCSVRQKSEDKVYGLGKPIKELLENKKTKPFVILTGCMVGSAVGERRRFEMPDLLVKTPWVDTYLGPNEMFKIPELLKKAGFVDFDSATFSQGNILPKLKNPKHAFVNISSGCDNFCTFCVVPYAKGEEVHKSEQDILMEIDKLTMGGVEEITLCGQNVNSWGLSKEEKFKIRVGSDQKLPFVGLLKRLCENPKLKKIEFISSNPFDFTQDLVAIFKLPKISNYLHIAVQSGNNDILKSMNRRHTVEDFLSLINDLRKVRPKIELGTDIIVGFPGESYDQFLDTCEFVRKVKFAVCFISMYSPRKGTYAQRLLKDDVSLAEKKKRHAELMKVWRESKRE